MVAINHFITDTDAEIAEVMKAAESVGAKAFLCTHWARGRQGHRGAGAPGGRCSPTAGRPKFKPLYPDEMPLLRQGQDHRHRDLPRLRIVADTSRCATSFKDLQAAGYGHLPVCMAKTQYSFSTDPNLQGAPTGHVVPIRELRLSAGAEFIVVVTGEIMTMPGLPKVPSANSIRLNEKGQIEGLF